MASTLALIIAIGGGGVAVAAVAVNSVGSPQIIDGSIKTRDLGLGSVSLSKIKPNAVGTAKVIDNSLRSSDVANGTLQHHDLSASKIGIVRGYAWVSTADSGIPLSTPTVLTNGYTYNSTGGDITLNHSAIGVYSVSFAGLDISPGHVQVTSYGSVVTWCKVGGWSGAPTNSPFTVALIE